MRVRNGGEGRRGDESFCISALWLMNGKRWPGGGGGSEGEDSSGDIKLEWKRNSEKLKRVCLVWNNS